MPMVNRVPTLIRKGRVAVQYTSFLELGSRLFPITVAYSQNESRNRTSFRIPMKSKLFECREFKIQKNFEILRWTSLEFRFL